MPKVVCSVTDKRGLVPFCKFLVEEYQFEIYASGGTYQHLAENGIAVRSVQELSGNPEAFGGRMKTISFPLLSGILFRRDHSDDVKQAQELNIAPIDMVICNLYPFEQVAQRENVTLSDLIENIDIGGPLLLRAAAKNYHWVAVVSDPDDYTVVQEALKKHQGQVPLTLRHHLALKVWSYTSWYDSVIFHCLGNLENKMIPSSFHQWPLGFKKLQELRYGENPHQRAIWFETSEYIKGNRSPIFSVLQGKELSYNNLLDVDAVIRILKDLHVHFPHFYSTVVVKHTIPCGLTCGEDLEGVFLDAWNQDPVSRFGGIIGIKGRVTASIAKCLTEVFVEVVVASDFDADALAIFAQKPNIRLLKISDRLMAEGGVTHEYRTILGGVLWQDSDNKFFSELQSVTVQEFPKKLEPLARFGEIAVKHFKSNALVVVDYIPNGSGFRLVAAGSGQPNRVDVLRLLIGSRLSVVSLSSSALLVSEAFFPFPDIIEEAKKLNINYIVQPGGSRQDSLVIQRANELGLVMAFSQVRHFRHG
ncbi:MAG: bifunctional phosphoribosylaminoimidazolecarboxamide formyltransferase/IMP cyclohydrolase [Bdellovibrionaceae bacterium]|nr:bifunctional phosphoribosylaminoimidazolecarboxamide formyltransferase/IMP cyclohydrolase [Pseudobdellovibrionaceae bacterium]MDW8189710.1 bifunctional phosphoribosylaminoimidazolecarboxamide formyltransferase/IMP cyclohydrolase [Pseudobdellovibrionaceae bacterium]